MTPQSRLFALLTPLRAGGILVTRNPTHAFTVPSAGAIILRDNPPNPPERTLSPSTPLQTLNLELQLFTLAQGTKSISQLTQQAITALKADRTLGGTIDQMFLTQRTWEIVPGGESVEANALNIQIVFGEEP